MSDSSEIDQALVMKLGADPSLLALMPNGVYWDQAPPNLTRFVIVSLIDATDVPQFGGRAFEDVLYLVKAVSRSDLNADMKAAAARIDALLDYGTLTVPGYSLMSLRRTERIRVTEVDDVDQAIRWFHRGGQYRVMVSPGT